MAIKNRIISLNYSYNSVNFSTNFLTDDLIYIIKNNNGECAFNTRISVYGVAQTPFNSQNGFLCNTEMADSLLKIFSDNESKAKTVFGNLKKSFTSKSTVTSGSTTINLFFRTPHTIGTYSGLSSYWGNNQVLSNGFQNNVVTQDFYNTINAMIEDNHQKAIQIFT